MAEKVSDEMKYIFYKVVNVSYWLVFQTFFLFSLEQQQKCGQKQTTALSSILHKKLRAKIVSLPKSLPHGSSQPQTDLEHRMKPIGSKLDEVKIKEGIRLAASNEKVAVFSSPNY